MNWGRGLFRLWLVLAVLWIAGMTTGRWRMLRCDFEPSRYGCNVFDQFDTPIDLSKLSEQQREALKETGGDLTKLPDGMRKSIQAALPDIPAWRFDAIAAAPPNYDKLTDDAELIIGPPILLLAVGGLLFWAMKGFRVDVRQ